jgi:hypothetical protein
MKLTSTLGLVAAIVAAVLTALELTTFQTIQPWHSLILYGLPAIAAFGIAPITHEKLDTLLHLTNQEVVGLTTLVGIAIAAVQSFSWSIDAKGIITGLLTLAGGVLFGTSKVIPVPVAPPVKR